MRIWNEREVLAEARFARKMIKNGSVMPCARPLTRKDLAIMEEERAAYRSMHIRLYGKPPYEPERAQ